MAYAETFWVVAGTAAPVISLAVVVAYPDQALLQVRLERTADMASVAARGRKLPVPGFLKVARVVAWAAAINFMAQTVLLWASLGSLMQHHNWMPPRLAMNIAAGGLVLLLGGALSAVAVNQMSQEPTDGPAPPDERGPVEDPPGRSAPAARGLARGGLPRRRSSPRWQSARRPRGRAGG